MAKIAANQRKEQTGDSMIGLGLTNNSMSSRGEVVRRSNASTTRTRRKNTSNSNGLRRKDRTRTCGLEMEHIRWAALVFFASFLLFAAVLFLYLRPRNPQYGTLDSERYVRAKAVRDAALSGEKLGGRKCSKGKNDSGKPGLRANKAEYSIQYLDPRQLPPLPGQPKEPYTFGKGNKHSGIKFKGTADDDWQAGANANSREHGD